MTIVQRSRRFEGFTPDGVLAWARRVLADCEGLRQPVAAGRLDLSARHTSQALAICLVLTECPAILYSKGKRISESARAMSRVRIMARDRSKRMMSLWIFPSRSKFVKC